MRKIFISHKRENGQSSIEATLIYNQLNKVPFFKPFMDVREPYMGEFPKTLERQITESDVFILIIPSNLNLSFLSDSDNWVHKEIKYVLYLNNHCHKNIKLIPISFRKNFIWDKEIDYSDIKDLLNYNIFYYDTNDTYSKKKLIKSIGFPKSKQLLYLCIGLIALLSIFFLSFYENSNKSKETSVFVENINKYNSLSSFSQNFAKVLHPYLDWYGDICPDKDISINNEFNETYLKYTILKFIILTYIANSVNDTEAEQDAKYVDELINNCYMNIPPEYKSVWSFNGTTLQQKTETLTHFLDSAIAYLQNRPDLKKLPAEIILHLKQKCLNSLWVSSEASKKRINKKSSNQTFSKTPTTSDSISNNQLPIQLLQDY